MLLVDRGLNKWSYMDVLIGHSMMHILRAYWSSSSTELLPYSGASVCIGSQYAALWR